jgi:Tol biopolymer transport system component
MGLTGESVRQVTQAGFNPAWSPDGKEIVYATEGIVNPLIRRHPHSEIYRVNLANNRIAEITSGDAVQPTWSPHGLRIAYWGLSGSGQRVISTLPADGGPAAPVTDGSSVDWNPVWSPDGGYLYFVSDRTGMPNLWRVPIDERSGKTRGQPEFVTRSDKVNMLLSLSRDGKRIAYASDGSRTSLEKLAFDPQSGRVSGPAVTLTETSHMIPTLDASRDGRWLVYQTFVPREELFVIRSDGTGGRQLLSGKLRDRQPRFSPDGKRIAFYSNRQGKYDLWIVNADGSQLEPVKLIPDRPAKHPIWSPTGLLIVCDLEENAALVDLGQPSDARHAQLLPRAPGGLGFSASSWSADGRWLAGSLHQPDGVQLPGVVLYSLEDRRYSQVAARGDGATWLSDSRHLLYWDGDRLILLDTRKRTSRPVLYAPQGSRYDDLALSPDDRFLYLARSTEESDIWLLTMK